MRLNKKKHNPVALAHLNGLLIEIKPLKARLDRLSRKYRTLATRADRKALMYQRQLETRGYSTNSLPHDQDAEWSLRFYNAYNLLSEIYSDISKGLSITHDGGSVHFGKMPGHPRDFEVLARLAEMKQQYADYLSAKRDARKVRRLEATSG
jgi:hypothetical protein